MEDMIGVVLGGGRGSRLFPLTQYRSKPAVPIGGSYRLVDVALSNCIHAGLRRIFVVTQYQSESLNRHVANAYKFDAFSSGFIDILAAEQTDDTGNDWFRGTADAVRKCWKHISRYPFDHIAILAGDQLYRMSLRDMLRVHVEHRAAATVASKPVGAAQTSGFGILKVDANGRIVHFDEKPPADRLPGLVSPLAGTEEQPYLASMGIYIFARNDLERALADPEHVDFGKQILPTMLDRFQVQAFPYDGYWEDVGTVRSYYEANLALTGAKPAFSFFHATYPIFTQRPFLAPSKIRSCRINDALVADGCYIEEAEIDTSVLGIRTRICDGVRIRRSLILGADDYETAAPTDGRPPLGIASGTSIVNAIIDKNAHIGRNVRIENQRGLRQHDGDGYFIRDGIVIVPKGAVIPDGTVI